MILAGLCAVLLGVAVSTMPGQDWVPFEVAATLARERAWHDVYPVERAISLFDVTDRFRALALGLGLNVPAAGVTAFISPPPAALMLAPMTAAPNTLSNAFWRLIIALPLCLAMFVFGEWRHRVAHVSPWQWAVVCLTAGILPFYIVGAGQPSGWLFVAAVCSVLPASRRVDAAGAVTLALACMTKATPVLVIVGLWFAGRRRFAVGTTVLLIVWVIGSWPWTGVEAWRTFLASATHIGGHVMADWNNASVDALLQRVVSGKTDASLQSPGMLVSVLGWSVRLLLLGAASLRVVRAHSPAARAGAVWVAWLASTPLLWTHYLTVLMPLLPMTSRGAWRPLLPLMAVSAGTWLVYANQRTAFVGALSCAGWLLAAALLLRSDAGEPQIEELGTVSTP